MLTMASTIVAVSASSRSRSAVNERSIFSTSIGKRFTYASDE